MAAVTVARGGKCIGATVYQFCEFWRFDWQTLATCPFSSAATNISDRAFVAFTTFGHVVSSHKNNIFEF